MIYTNFNEKKNKQTNTEVQSIRVALTRVQLLYACVNVIIYREVCVISYFSNVFIFLKECVRKKVKRP